MSCPPGWAPNRSAIVALSLKVAPTVPEAGSWVVRRLGAALPTVTGSSSQPEAAGALFGSEERGVGQGCGSGWGPDHKKNTGRTRRHTPSDEIMAIKHLSPYLSI